LFPDSHLFGGATIVGLWAAAAALVPLMSKGNDLARLVHVALNALNLLVFCSQVVTGWDILGQAWEATHWP
jgi:uncharacterized membrane protein